MKAAGNTGRAHLALFISGFRVGGVERVMLTLAGALAERGYRVDLLAPAADGPYRERVPAGVNVVNLSRWYLRVSPVQRVKRRRSLLAALPLAAYLRRARPDALLSAAHYPNLAAIWGHRLARSHVRLVITQHTHLSMTMADTRSRLSGGKRLGYLVRRYYPFADAIVAVSEDMAGNLAAIGQLPHGRVVTIYNPTITPDIDDLAAEPLTNPWLTDEDAPLILAVGRLVRKKDFPNLLKAFAALRRKSQARLAILGEGKLRDELTALAERLGVADAVSMPGYAPNPYAWMARADLFVLSSRHEGLPGVLIEALACGCPVVSTDCPSGPREILDGGRFGTLVPVGDSDALAAAMDAALDRPRDSARLKARAAMFSVDRCVDKYLDLLLPSTAANAGDPQAANGLYKS